VNAATTDRGAGAGFVWVERAGMRWLAPKRPDWPSHAVVGFATRAGGASQGIYGGLNLGMGSGDAVEIVMKNRIALGNAAGVPVNRWVVGGQVHGTTVATVGSNEAGRGGIDRTTTVKETDGLATSEPGLLLFTLVADCLPIVLADPDRPALSTLHAGWRGSAAGMAAAGVRAMKEQFGSDPARLFAAIGPGIGGCCYQVGSEVTDQFRSEESTPDREDPTKRRLDLSAANARMLAEAGVAPDRILRADLCTSCRADLFYSWRREKGQTGRQGSFAYLIPS